VSGQRDRGVALVTLALCLTVLMIFAAFAVDVGAARSARRKAQGTVDGSTLAGGQFLLTADGHLAATTADAIAEEVIEVTHLNFTADATLTDAGTLTLEQWRSRFASCSDADRDTTLFPVRSTISDCISFNNPITRVRVRLPDLNVATYFAGVMGIDELHTHAAAEVELVPDNLGGLLPFGLPSANAEDAEICLKGENQPTLPPCDGGEEGNFGNLDVATYGNSVLGTSTMCNGDTQNRLSGNIALGVDHLLSTYSSGTPISDRDECPDLAVAPNEIMAQTGVGSSLDQGLITGLTVNGHAVAGRLTRGPWADRNVRGGWTLDDRPLWDFIDPSLTAAEVPAECVPGTISSRAHMTQCIDAYRRGHYTVALFTRDDDGDLRPDILQSPRMAWVPQLHAQVWGEPDDTPQRYRIRAFLPVFIQTLYFSCSNNAHGPAGCDGYFNPGEGDYYFDPDAGDFATGPLAENKTLEAVTAMLLTDSMVGPATLSAGPNGLRTYQLVLRR
jgi:hypothetical protein